MTNKLTVAGVLRATCPDGISLETWTSTIAEAVETNKVWGDDPWVKGSKEWEAFYGVEPEPLRIISRDTSRTDFKTAVGRVFPTTGPRSTRGSVLLAYASYGDAAGANVYPANGTVADTLQLSREAVNRHVRWAITAGWLRPTGKVGRAVKYHLSRPDGNASVDDV